MRTITPRYIAVLAGLVFSLLLADTARAEGWFTSYIAYWRTGNTSRVWTDKNTDAWSTYVYFEDCRDGIPENDPNDSAEIAVIRQLAWQPDVEVARRTLYCHNWGDAYYGDVQAGDYYFKLTKITGQCCLTWQTLDVPYLYVSW